LKPAETTARNKAKHTSILCFWRASKDTVVINLANSEGLFSFNADFKMTHRNDRV